MAVNIVFLPDGDWHNLTLQTKSPDTIKIVVCLTLKNVLFCNSISAKKQTTKFTSAQFQKCFVHALSY